MQTTTSRRYWLSFAALLLVLPSAWFFCINLLNEAGISGPYNVSQPVFESLGIKESPGWNINLLILLGPVIALLLSVFQVLIVEWHFTKEQLRFNIILRKKWLPIIVAGLSLLLLAAVFMYILGENCNC
jgi:hypothetical protein